MSSNFFLAALAASYIALFLAPPLRAEPQGDLLLTIYGTKLRSEVGKMLAGQEEGIRAFDSAVLHARAGKRDFTAPEFDGVFKETPTSIFTLGNNLTHSPEAELIYVAYPLTQRACAAINRRISQSPVILRLDKPLNLTPYNKPVGKEDVVNLPSKKSIVCYQGPDEIYYYLHLMWNR